MYNCYVSAQHWEGGDTDLRIAKVERVYVVEDPVTWLYILS